MFGAMYHSKATNMLTYMEPSKNDVTAKMAFLDPLLKLFHHFSLFFLSTLPHFTKQEETNLSPKKQTMKYILVFI